MLCGRPASSIGQRGRLEEEGSSEHSAEKLLTLRASVPRQAAVDQMRAWAAGVVWCGVRA